MKLEKWALIAEVVGGVAIVLSLIFVGVEVRQSSKAQLQSATQAVVSEYNAGIRQIAVDPQLACIYVRGIANFESLSTTDRVSLSAYLLSIMNAYQQMRTLQLQGSIDTTVWRGFESQMKEIVSYPGVRQWFEFRRHWYSADFQAYVDTLRIKSQSNLPAFLADEDCGDRDLAAR